MSDTTDLPDLAADYRNHATAWRESLRPGTGKGPEVERAYAAAADWEALAALVDAADALTRLVDGNPGHAVRAARRLAGVIEDRTSAAGPAEVNANHAPLDLDAMEARANAATPPPWHAGGNGPLGDAIEPFEVVLSGKLPIVELESVADAEFIAGARTWMPALVARVRQAEAALAAVLSLTRDTDGNALHIDAEIPVSEIWRVTTEETP